MHSSERSGDWGVCWRRGRANRRLQSVCCTSSPLAGAPTTWVPALSRHQTDNWEFRQALGPWNTCGHRIRVRFSKFMESKQVCSAGNHPKGAKVALICSVLVFIPNQGHKCMTKSYDIYTISLWFFYGINSINDTNDSTADAWHLLGIKTNVVGIYTKRFSSGSILLLGTRQLRRMASSRNTWAGWC